LVQKEQHDSAISDEFPSNTSSTLTNDVILGLNSPFLNFVSALGSLPLPLPFPFLGASSSADFSSSSSSSDSAFFGLEAGL
jgi:hypothetical protein